MWQYHFSEVEEANSKLLALGHCLLKYHCKIANILREDNYILVNTYPL